MTRAFNTETFTLTGKIVARSKAAILFAIYPTDLSPSVVEFSKWVEDKSADVEMSWFPNSQTKKLVESFSILDDKLDTIVITQWVAKQKGYL